MDMVQVLITSLVRIYMSCAIQRLIVDRTTYQGNPSLTHMQYITFNSGEEKENSNLPTDFAAPFPGFVVFDCWVSGLGVFAST